MSVNNGVIATVRPPEVDTRKIFVLNTLLAPSISSMQQDSRVTLPLRAERVFLIPIHPKHISNAFHTAKIPGRRYLSRKILITHIHKLLKDRQVLIHHCSSGLVLIPPTKEVEEYIEHKLSCDQGNGFKLSINIYSRNRPFSKLDLFLPSLALRMDQIEHVFSNELFIVEVFVHNGAAALQAWDAIRYLMTALRLHTPKEFNTENIAILEVGYNDITCSTLIAFRWMGGFNVPLSKIHAFSESVLPINFQIMDLYLIKGHLTFLPYADPTKNILCSYCKCYGHHIKECRATKRNRRTGRVSHQHSPHSSSSSGRGYKNNSQSPNRGQHSTNDSHDQRCRSHHNDRRSGEGSRRRQVKETNAQAAQTSPTRASPSHNDTTRTISAVDSTPPPQVAPGPQQASQAPLLNMTHSESESSSTQNTILTTTSFSSTSTPSIVPTISSSDVPLSSVEVTNVPLQDQTIASLDIPVHSTPPDRNNEMVSTSVSLECHEIPQAMDFIPESFTPKARFTRSKARLMAMKNSSRQEDGEITIKPSMKMKQPKAKTNRRETRPSHTLPLHQNNTDDVGEIQNRKFQC